MEAERELDEMYFDLWDESYEKSVVVSDDTDDDDEDFFYDVAGSQQMTFRRIDDL
jgi:hypothetical protein